MSGLTHMARDDARRNGGIGCGFVIGAVLVALGAYAMGGTAKGLDAVAYWLGVSFVVTCLVIVAVILLKHWIDGEKDCNWNDNLAENYKPRVRNHHSTDDFTQHTGPIHYDGTWPIGLSTYIGPHGETITVQSGYNESTGEYWQEIS